MAKLIRQTESTITIAVPVPASVKKRWDELTKLPGRGIARRLKHGIEWNQSLAAVVEKFITESEEAMRDGRVNTDS